MNKLLFVIVFYSCSLWASTISELSSFNQYKKAQEIELSLEDAIALALRNNRSIKSAYLDRVAQKFDLSVEQDRFNPKINIITNVYSRNNNNDKSSSLGFSPNASLLSAYGTRFSLSWSMFSEHAKNNKRSRNDGANFYIIQPLLKGGGRKIATSPLVMAQLAEQGNKLNLKNNVAQTITNVIYSFRGLIKAQEQVIISKSALERAKKLIKTNRELINAGRMAEYEIIQTEAEVVNQELALENAINQLDNNRMELLRLLALDQESLIIAKETIKIEKVSIDYAQAISKAKLMQPRYLIELIIKEQIDLELAVAKNNKLWDLSIEAGAGQSKQWQQLNSNPTNKGWDNYIGLRLEIPIGDLSRKQGEVRALVNIEKHKLQIEETIQVMEKDIANAVRNINTRWRQYQIALKALALSHKKLEFEQEKLKVGRSSNFQVLSFEADLRNAEVALLETRIAYLNAQADLDYIVGTTLESWDIALYD